VPSQVPLDAMRAYLLRGKTDHKGASENGEEDQLARAQKAFEHHLDETEGEAERLELMFKILGKPVRDV